MISTIIGQIKTRAPPTETQTSTTENVTAFDFFGPVVPKTCSDLAVFERWVSLAELNLNLVLVTVTY